MVAASGAVPIIGQSQPQEDPAEEDAVLNVVTAFIVYKDKDGGTIATNSLKYFGDTIRVERVAHPDEMDGMCASVRTDIAVQKGAMAQHQLQMATARAIAAQQQNAAILSQLRDNGKL